MDTIMESMDMSLSKLWETVKDRETWPAAVHEVAKSGTHHISSRSLIFPQLRIRKTISRQNNNFKV